jgi:hypothetical protein
MLCSLVVQCCACCLESLSIDGILTLKESSKKKKKIEQNTRNKTKGSVKLAKLKKSQLHAVYFAEIYTLLSRVANKTYTQNNAFRSM